MTADDEHAWWQRGVFYQIYMPSFQDSDGDGWGDFTGIIQRLDYLDWLGIDCLWLTPFYPSPMKDFGYDVRDYTAVAARYGTLQDFDELVQKAHGRGMRVLCDLVPNHTSDEHPWFQASKTSRDHPKRDWYVWADPAPNGGPPTNWLSEFGGSAWEWHEPSGQYYLHSFHEGQPDLNWYNPAVREAIYEAMRFWLDRGVDGFRVDVMWHMIKDPQLRNDPPNPDYNPDRHSPYHRLDPLYSTDRPDVHEVVRQMRGVVDEYDDRVLIGEVYLPTGKLVSYYGRSEPEAHMPFNFQLIETPWDAPHIRQVVDRYESAVQDTGWPNWVLGNHDVSRVASRLGQAQARTAAVMQLTLRGTPTLYYGEELGLQNVEIPAERVLDPRGERAPGLGLGRDPERTPMPWSSEPHAGFTDGDPWLPLADDCRENNVETQREDPHSTLSLYRRLIAFHHREPAIMGGSFIPVEVDSGLFSYLRCDADSAFLVILNLTNRERTFRPEHSCGAGDLVISTHDPEPGKRFSSDGHMIRPNEGLVVRLDEMPEYYAKPSGSTMNSE